MNQDHSEQKLDSLPPYILLGLMCFGLGGLELLFRLGMYLFLESPDAQFSPGFGLFVFIPCLIGLFLVRRFRWSFMAAVGYGTIALALDISTIVHGLNQAEPMIGIVRSLCTGLLAFLLILIGGKELLSSDQNGKDS
jgi:hypothetical protein